MSGRPDGRDAVIVEALRSPTGKGKPGGALSGRHPVDLLAEVMAGLVARAGIDPAHLDDVLIGCVTQIGEQSFNLARNAVLAAGFPESVPAATIDRQCGSSQQALAFACHAVGAGAQDAVLVGGVESMSRVRMGSSAAGADPFGAMLHGRYPAGLVPQGVSAEMIAARWGISREEADAFAVRSHRQAATAAADGRVDDELLAVVRDRGEASGVAVGPPASADAGEGGAGRLLTRDEGVRPGTSLEGLAGLEPAFRDARWTERFPDLSWVVHAGNASQLADGAAALLVASADRARAWGLVPRARVVANAVVGSDPLMNLTGVIPATRRVLERAGMSLADVDVFEVNEAFAPVVLAWLRDTGVDPDKVNLRGGAIANGHPLGASGCKLTATLLGALDDADGTLGLQVMCEGGGMANATLFERLHPARAGIRT